jgi:hypothetical protein
MVYSNDKSKAEEKMNELINFLSERSIIKRGKDYVKTTIGTFMAKKFTDGCRGTDIKKYTLIKTFGKIPQTYH